MKIFWRCLEAGFALAALTLVCLFCTYAWPESTYGLAAWVQAVGSIGAIGGAFLISANQFQNARRQDATRRALDNNRKIRIVSSLLEKIRMLVDDLSDDFYGDALSAVARARIDGFLRCQQQLNSLPLLEMPSSEVVQHVVYVSTFLQNFIDSVSSTQPGAYAETALGFCASDNRGRHPDVAKGLEVCFDWFISLSDSVESAIQACLGALVTVDGIVVE